MAVIDGQGGDNALHAHRLAAWIEAADALHGRRVLYLRDRDELPRRLLERLQQSGAVHVLERRELENYLLDAEAIQKVLSERLGRFDLDPAAVAVAMRQIADGLKATVLVKRVGWELAPITFVDHKLRDELGRTKPPLEQFQDIVLGRLPERDDLTGHIGELWRNAEDAIASAWEDQWSSLAPGHDLLVALWATYGIKYDKQRDGTAIAKAIAEPPYELGKALREFLAD